MAAVENTSHASSHRPVLFPSSNNSKEASIIITALKLSQDIEAHSLSSMYRFAFFCAFTNSETMEIQTKALSEHAPNHEGL